MVGFSCGVLLGWSDFGWGPVEHWNWPRPLFMSRKVLLVTARGRRAPQGRHKCLDGAEPRLGAGGLSPNRAPVRRAPSQLPVRSRPRTSTRLGLEAYAAKVVWSSQQAHRIATARRIRTASIPAPRTSSSNHFEAQKARFQPQKPWCSCRGRDHFEFCS